MKLYLASPFFSQEEIINVDLAEKILRKAGHDVFSPRENKCCDEETGINSRDAVVSCNEETDSPAWAEKIFAIAKAGIDSCDAVVMLYYSNYSDTGTAWECGYAYASGKPVIVVHITPSATSNLMIHVGSYSNIIGLSGLIDYDFTEMPKYTYTGYMT